MLKIFLPLRLKIKYLVVLCIVYTKCVRLTHREEGSCICSTECVITDVTNRILIKCGITLTGPTVL